MQWKCLRSRRWLVNFKRVYQRFSRVILMVELVVRVETRGHRLCCVKRKINYSNWLAA